MASPWTAKSGSWRIETPAGPIRLEAPSGSGEALLVLRRQVPPIFRLTLTLTVRPEPPLASSGMAIVYPRYRSGRDAIRFQFEPKSGIIAAVCRLRGRSSGGDSLGFHFRAGEPVFVEIVSGARVHELRARSGAVPDPTVGSGESDGARLIVHHEEAAGEAYLALGGLACAALFDRIGVEPLATPRDP